MRYGTIIEYFEDKKYGFIRPDVGPDVFFHISAIGACDPRLKIRPGQPVKYELISTAAQTARAIAQGRGRHRTRSAARGAGQARRTDRQDPRRYAGRRGHEAASRATPACPAEEADLAQIGHLACVYETRHSRPA